MSANLQNVQDALHDFVTKKYRSIRQSTSAHGIGKSTVARRLHGRKPRAESHSSLMRVTPAQEVLVKWLKDLQRQILPLNHATLRDWSSSYYTKITISNLLDSTGLLDSLNDIHPYKQRMEDPWTFSGF